jgi:membrane protease YdiL (CAAX protease family)
MDSPEPMNEEVRLEPQPPPEPPEPDRDPFWGYSDLLLFTGLTVPCLLLGMLLVRGVMALFRLHAGLSVAVQLPEQVVGYALLFGALRLMFLVQYGRPFWSSLGWKPFAIPAPYVTAAGAFTAVAAMMAGALIRLPQKENQMTDVLSQGNVAVLLMAVFGVVVAPLCEELAFRGFLQPLVARSFGAPAGILIAGAAFGLLHFREYGNSWRHALLLTGAGACFGWMRHATKSTKAAVIMHASYNGLLFLLLAIALIAERNPHH